jgi:hypothetical protein
MDYSPIVLFTYKRLDTLKQTVECLKENIGANESDLYIYSDAARSEKDKTTIDEVRAFLKTITGFKKVLIIEATQNKGLANSIIEGVSEVIQKYGKVIVLEDDLKTTSNFLTFMNNSLDRYEKEKKVFSVSGYSFDLGIDKNETQDAYFINRGWSWGWATWSDRWNEVDWNVKNYSSFIKDPKARKEFSLGGSDLNKMLDTQMSGKLDSWAIRWFYHQFRIKGLTIYPILSKIYNNGFDEDATHTTGSDKRYQPALDNVNKTSFKLPDAISLHPFYQKKFQDKMGIKARIISKLQTIFQKIIK